MTRHFKITRVLFHIILFILLKLSTHTVAEDTCDAIQENPDTKNDILHKHKLRAIPTILIVSTISTFIPILSTKVSELKPGTNGYFIIKTFTGTAILSTGLTLVLPDFFKSFSWNNNDIFSLEIYAMISTILILLVNFVTWSTFICTSLLILTIVVFDKIIDGDWSSAQRLTPLLAMVHSLIFGISTGLSTDLITAKLLLTALTLHQYCEGISIGEVIVKFNEAFKVWPLKVLLCFTLLVAPVGIGIGICISSFDNDGENGVKELFDLGLVWILTCRVVVDLCALMYVRQSSAVVVFGAMLMVLVGAGCMSLLAIWA